MNNPSEIFDFLTSFLDEANMFNMLETQALISL